MFLKEYIYIYICLNVCHLITISNSESWSFMLFHLVNIFITGFQLILIKRKPNFGILFIKNFKSIVGHWG